MERYEDNCALPCGNLDPDPARRFPLFSGGTLGPKLGRVATNRHRPKIWRPSCKAIRSVPFAMESGLTEILSRGTLNQVCRIAQTRFGSSGQAARDLFRVGKAETHLSSRPSSKAECASRERCSYPLVRGTCLCGLASGRRFDPSPDDRQVKECPCRGTAHGCPRAHPSSHRPQ